MLWEQTIRFGIEKQKTQPDERKHWQLKRLGSERKNL